MDKGRLGGYKLRFLFGGNEENDSLGLKHYFKSHSYPTLGFSPDANYPLIYAEKSIYSYTASYPLT
jgi:succinyl-diaminopimelate desuccinylase